ncbi:MAG TPA: PAS domain S-box protein [Azospirillum sp.]|nr:PAS domain S-box protein [Azospirillum sp.]
MDCNELTRGGPADKEPISAEWRFQLLVEHVHDYAIYMLDPNGIVSSWNAGAQRFKGYTPSEIIGQHFSRFYTEEDRAADVPMQALQTAEWEGKFETEGWRVRKDGSRFWASVVIDPIRNEAGELIGFAKITRDITERKAAQDALERAQAQLHQAQKMEAVGQLSGGIAHDFNNLLQALAGCLQIIERRTTEPSIRPILEAGHKAVQRGAKLVQQLMAFARQESLHTKPVDVRDQVLGMSELLTRALRADIRVESDFAPGLWPVEVDPTQFELALLNLAVNARDAMPGGGTLSVHARNVSLASGDPSGVAGEFVQLTISDTGTGMPPEVQARAFDPFFTTKKVGKGTGLGLAQVYGLARHSSGTAWIETEEGRGTRVHLLLRRSGAIPAARGERPSDDSANLRRSGRVLVVEDDPIVAMTVATALENAGFMVTRATTADEALPMLAAGEIDLLFSDVVMPGSMSGVDLAHAAQRLHPGLSVVLTTGYSEEIARATGIQVLPKPFPIEHLARVLDTALANAERGRKTA